MLIADVKFLQALGAYSRDSEPQLLTLTNSNSVFKNFSPIVARWILYKLPLGIGSKS
jgi:hypothetical protein